MKIYMLPENVVASTEKHIFRQVIYCLTFVLLLKVIELVINILEHTFHTLRVQSFYFCYQLLHRHMMNKKIFNLLLFDSP